MGLNFGANFVSYADDIAAVVVDLHIGVDLAVHLECLEGFKDGVIIISTWKRHDIDMGQRPKAKGRLSKGLPPAIFSAKSMTI